MNNANSSDRSAKKTSFASDVLKLVSGTVFAQVLTIAASPFLTRLYGPEAFGLLALFSSITSIISVISCLRYELAILLPKTDKEAANLLAVSLGFVVLISIFTIPIVWLGRTIILDLLKTPALGLYLWLVPPTVFFSGIFLAFNYWNSRTKHFGRLSLAQAFQSFTSTASQLAMGYAGHGIGGSLIGSSLVGSALSSLVLSRQIWRDNSRLFKESITWRGMLAGLKCYAKFPLHNTWAALLNTISWQLPALLLSTFFSTSVVGYYALAFRLINLPMMFIGRAIGQVFLQRASIAKYNGTLPKLVEQTLINLIQLVIFPLLTIILIGHDLIILVFGNRWGESGIYLQILGFWAIIWLITSPIDDLLQILERQKESLCIHAAILLSRLLGLSMGGYIGNARISLLLFSISGVVVYSYLLIRVIYLSGASLNIISRKFISEIMFILPVAILVITMHLSNANSALIIAMTSVITITFFYFRLRNKIPLILIKK